MEGTAQNRMNLVEIGMRIALAIMGKIQCCHSFDISMIKNEDTQIFLSIDFSCFFLAYKNNGLIDEIDFF